MNGLRWPSAMGNVRNGVRSKNKSDHCVRRHLENSPASLAQSQDRIGQPITLSVLTCSLCAQCPLHQTERPLAHCHYRASSEKGVATGDVRLDHIYLVVINAAAGASPRLPIFNEGPFAKQTRTRITFSKSVMD